MNHLLPRDHEHAALLRQWSEQLCRLPQGGPAEMAEVMEVEGTVVEHGTFSTIEPPPEGTTRLTLHKHPASFEYAQIYLSGNMLTRAQLDAHFGQSVELPRMGPYSAYRVAYQVKVLGAPFSFAVIPAFDETPTPGASATEVLLRRDPA